MPVDPKARAQERKDNGWGDGDRGEKIPRVDAKVKALFAACGTERYESSGKGTPALMVRFICVDDPSAEKEKRASEVGHILDVDFWLTPKALGALADLALAFGWEEPFDENDDDHIDAILQNGSGAIWITTKNEPYNDKDRFKAAYYSKYAHAEPNADWEEIIDRGVVSWEDYLAMRAKFPRKAPGTGGGSSSGGGGGGNQSGGGSGGGERRRAGSGGGGSSGGGGREDTPPYTPDDDIPFARESVINFGRFEV